jgi:hypothetical protein
VIRFTLGLLAGALLLLAFQLAGEKSGREAARSRAGVGAVLIADAPRVTRSWRCKKRPTGVYCHTYRHGAKDFAEAAKALRPPLRMEPWSRRWCSPAAPCRPLVTDL